jgi:hypothetical protein
VQGHPGLRPGRRPAPVSGGKSARRVCRDASIEHQLRNLRGETATT